MGEPAPHPRNIHHSQFGDNTVITQGDFHYHGPHPPTTKAVVRIPYPRNEDIVPRPELTEKLDALLLQTSKYCSAALWGLGGSGKTQIALEYAYRRCDDPKCSVLWVHADNEATFSQDYKSIAKELGLDANLKGKDLLRAVRDGIKALPQWVLILDNADDLTIFGIGKKEDQTTNLDEYVPRAATGTVLWTSRDERIKGSLVGPRRGIAVARMSSDEANQLLTICRDDENKKEEIENAALIQELQCLPLAISQAGAYMRRTETSAKEYLALLEQTKMRWHILKETQHDRHRRSGVPNSILETWAISMDHIRQTSEMAYRILHVIAYLNNQDIPHEMIAAIAKHTVKDPPDQPEEMLVIDAITRLKEFSFLSTHTVREEGRSYEMHMLVHEAVRYGLQMRQRMQMDDVDAGGRSRPEDETEGYFSEIALHVVTELFPKSEKETWPACDRYLPHAVKVGGWAELCGKEVETSQVLDRVSMFLYHQGRWREKESIDERGLKLRRKVLGERHPDTIRTMSDLAVTCWQQGRFNEAETMSLLALELRQEVLGEIHPDTIRSMASLASTYHAQGRYKEAEPIELKVLELRREVLGERHPDTIWSMANLASTYHAQGRYKEAEPIDLKVLELQREVLGEIHPDTIWSMANLASTYSAQGRYKEAEPIELKVLELRREVLGEIHPDTIRSMASLASTYHTQGRYKEAEPIELKVLELRREVLGERHPDTLYAMWQLAFTWKACGRYDDALSLIQQCVDGQTSILRPDHPKTQESNQTLEEWKKS
ncbi:hypothetical protein EDB81DRAFT_877796 [Dactylonectria macrodidyma]|uniref:ORC1/DEAH AAA+ ATPase domain-containing protein n=1 Tax=Dactylonectria macrodidyma TaxID=307937 RepID=A0A9P9JJP6_9HYPO|nr:hypothetical protein EDB81DRAFT_877796 [Dactylonectria macrodidyma]